MAIDTDTYGMSLGVSGLEEGVGKLINIGPVCCDMVAWCMQ